MSAPTLQPRPGFRWQLVNWSAPDQTQPERCSYCGDPFPDDDDSDFIPLMMWNAEGWCAAFCDHCQAAWWGIQKFDEPPESDEP